MILEGNITINLGIDNVREKLSKLELVIPCLPNLVSWEIVEEKKAKASFRVDLQGVPIDSLARVTANTEILVEDVNANRIKYYFKGKGAGINYVGRIEMDLEEITGGTKISWKAEADLGGFQRFLGKFIDIDKVIRKIAQDTVNGITNCLSKK